MTKSTDVEPTVRDEYESAQKVAKHVGALLQSEGWKILQDVARAQIEARQISNSVPMYKTDDVLYRQLACGEILGIQLFLATPESMVEDAKVTIERLKDEVKDE